jgi:hypothetical protein
LTQERVRTSGDGVLILIGIMIVLLDTGHYGGEINAISPLEDI